MSAAPHVLVASPPAAGEGDAGRLRAHAVADAHARFRRARGEDVALMLALDEPDASRRLESLAMAVDDERSLALDDPLVTEWSQRLIERLAAAGLVYERAGARFLRTSAFAEESDRRLAELDGWTDAALASQRELLRRVDGVELQGQALDGTPLTLFTPHPDSIADAEFVGLSPQVHDIDVDMSVQVPGVPQPLPVVVSESIDARFGPTATLGIPSVDPADQELTRDLPKRGGLAWKTDAKPPKTTPAVRFVAADMPLSDERRFAAAWIELALAVPPAERAEAVADAPRLAERLPIARTVAAPDAGRALLDMRTVAKALRDAGALDLPDGEPLGPTLLCAPLTLAGDTPLDDLIAAHGADALRFALLYAAAPEKPFAGSDALVRHCAGLLAELRALAERLAAPGDRPPSGPAASNGAAPAGGGPSGAQPPEPRIDMGDGLRRRLAGWCDTAVERTAENHERLDMHRATRNALELLARTQDFERRVGEHRGELAGADREAATIAVGVLLRLLAPLAPTFADDLWHAAGHPGAATAAPWPTPQRAPVRA